MCPAFGSLRVGLRMRRTATILSGSACCVYGLTFTSHFYGARRTVGYVPFNSETLVTGKLFEDIREAVFKLADPALYDTIVVTNLCVPTASGVPLRLLPKEINGVRIIGIDVPGFGVPTHAEAKDVLAGAMLNYARSEAEQGPVAGAAARPRPSSPTVTLLGEMFPADPDRSSARMLEPLGLAAGPVVPTREWRELYAALDCAAVAAIHPFYTASIREFEAAGRPIVGSGAGRATTAPPPGSRRSAQACGVAGATKIDGRQGPAPARRSGPRSRAVADPGPHHAVGLRGLRASRRAPARRERRRRALCRHRLPAHAAGPRPTATGSRRAARRSSIRASLEQDLAAHARSSGPTSPSARRRSCRRRRSWRDPGALLHQPDLGAAAVRRRRRGLARAGGQRRASATRRASTR